MLYWNINGRFAFLKDTNILAWLNNSNLIFLSAHFTKGQIFDIYGYNVYHNSNSDVLDTKSRGGISYFIKNNIHPHVKTVNITFDYHIVVDFKNNYRIVGSYIPPIDSIYYNESIYADIPYFINHIDSDAVIIGGGDLNSRIGNCKRTPFNVSNCFYRPNPDTTVNSHGLFLKRLCSAYKYFILNNLTVGDRNFDGDFTVEKANRRSQNDICITNLSGFKYITEFKIHNIPFNFSDHRPVSICCEFTYSPYTLLKDASYDILTESSINNPERPRKVNNVL